MKEGFWVFLEELLKMNRGAWKLVPKMLFGMLIAVPKVIGLIILRTRLIYFLGAGVLNLSLLSLLPRPIGLRHFQDKIFR